MPKTTCVDQVISCMETIFSFQLYMKSGYQAQFARLTPFPSSPESYILELSVYSHCILYNMCFFQLYHIHVWSPVMAGAFMAKYSTVLWCSPTDKLSCLLNIYIISRPWLVLTTQWTSLCIAFIFLKSIPRFLKKKVNFIRLLVEYFVCKVEFIFFNYILFYLYMYVCGKCK